MSPTESDYEHSIAVVICTYNPEPHIFSRLLDSLSKWPRLHRLESVVIVDNNSRSPVSQLECTRYFLASCANARCIVEQSQGLTAARCRGIRETKSSVVIFFDDDNEPSSEYATILSKYFLSYECVGVWGPGSIQVEFVDGAPAEVRARCDLFQERRSQFGYACIPGYYSDYSPNGTGFAVRRTILDHYVQAVEDGKLNASDRNGASLSSAGDAQIVWEATKLGYACGLIKELECRHNISARKANIDYLSKLAFGLASSHMPALQECFPEIASNHAYPPTLYQVIRLHIRLACKKFIGRATRLDTAIAQASALGSAYGSSLITRPNNARRVLLLARLLGFS